MSRQVGILNTVKQRIATSGLSAFPQPSYLRIEQQIVSGQSQYSFNIKNDSGVSATENKLDQNDAFVVSKVGIALFKEAVVSGVRTQPGTGVLQYYPNATVFAAEAGNLDPAQLENFWNSNLEVKVADTVYFDSLWMKPSRTVRTTQQSSATNKSEAFLYDGLFDIDPIITFQGSRKNDIVLQLPNFNGAQQQYVTANERVFVTLLFWGILITGGSNLGRIDYNQ
jgi:hypothetical protein